MAFPQRDEKPRRPIADRHHGGQEPPDDQQDRPEQNAGYDAVVRGEAPSPASGPVDEMGIDSLADPKLGIDQMDEAPGSRPAQDPDTRAEQEAIAEVRRRERRNP
jgi:hypothetical protein